MNPVEAVGQKVVIALLNDLKTDQAKIQSFLTSGLIPSEMQKVIAEIEKILSYLKPIINEIDSLIPPEMPELKLVLDWATKIINVIPS